MKFMKKRKIRRIASLFMAVLMVAALMPGSITNTKADDKTADSGVVVDAGTWENNERTTTWDFSKYSLIFSAFPRLVDWTKKVLAWSKKTVKDA